MVVSKKEDKILRLILGDQLNSNHSWYKVVRPEVTYVMMEIRSETDYVWHHIQKVAGFFAAMRDFSSSLGEMGHQVLYLYLDSNENRQSFQGNLNWLIENNSFSHFEYQLPDEFRVDQLLKNYCKELSISYTVYDSEHFFTSRSELSEFFKGKKSFLMENFYRHMRKKHRILMNGDEPVLGKWNFDIENRKKLPADHKTTPPLLFDNDVSAVVDLIQKAEIKTIGEVNSKKFFWPVNRKQSLALLDFFVKQCLPLFGTFQDAMTPHDWSLYHSRLSFSMNTKQLSPLEVINAAVEEWKRRPEVIAFNQLEGFVRQIIGWREYMRGIYWLKMPEYATLNFFDHQATLPEWYWTGKTRMNCLKHSIQQSLQYAYAHHIQRLMVTGNFALLVGVHPDEVDFWYLGIYIDALEWVEITNTRGMSQFADGGIVGTKPYVSSASYINKMSHYCGSCFYNKSKKVGDRACPFNSLYWNFYERHEEKLAKNHRISMMYKIWNKMQPEEKAALLEQAHYYLENINEL